MNFQKNGRIYKVGGSLQEIHQSVIEKLIQWNTNEAKNDRKLDFAFALSILLSIVSVEKIAEGENLTDALALMNGMFLSWFL